MILNRLLGRKTRDIEAVYSAIVTAARQRHFYADWGVPDTVDGRFDMIVVHLFLVLERLRMEKVHRISPIFSTRTWIGHYARWG
jgi:cytochrome b pre-mRNA-processing protein 3